MKRKLLGKLIGNKASGYDNKVGKFLLKDETTLKSGKKSGKSSKKSGKSCKLCSEFMFENLELKDRLNKAIEHINNVTFTIDEYEKRLLLKILKGEQE